MAPIANHDANPASPGMASGDGGRLSMARLDAGNPRGPTDLVSTRTFNDCGDAHAARNASPAVRPAGNQSGPQSPIGSGAVHPSFASAPGAGLPEFRALLFLVSWPLFVIAFTAAVVWIFL